MKTIYALTTLLVCLFGCVLMSDAQTFSSVDINPGIDSSNPYIFAVVNGKLVFTATDGVHGTEPWVSDGTSGGTMMLADIWPGSHSSNVRYITAINSLAYITANDSVHGYQVWVTDGTPGGTHMLTIIGPGNLGTAYGYTLYNNLVYFGANDSVHGFELWSTDGTAGGTNMVADIWPGTGSGDPGDFGGFAIYNGKLYFDASDSVHGQELWVTDGTTLGTHMVADIYTGHGNSTPGSIGGLTVFNNALFFSARDSIHGRELWTSDGTSGGTVMVKDIWTGTYGGNAGEGGSDPRKSYTWIGGGFYSYGGKLYFNANDSVHGYELWRTDGTTLGTVMVSDIWPGTGSSNAAYTGMVPYNNLMYFGASDSVHGTQLWYTDGSICKQVTNIDTSGDFYPYSLTDFKSKLYFIGDNTAQGASELYVSDGTDTGTHVIEPAIAPNNDPVYRGYSYLYPFGNSLAYGAAYTTTIGLELWFYTPPVTAIGSVGNLANMHVYPNPFNNEIMIDGLHSGETYDVTLTDILGNVVTRQQIAGTGAATQVDISNCSGGVYLLRLANGNTATTIKLVKR